MTANTLYGEEDASLFSNNFGFMRFDLVFRPDEADADVVITGVPFDLATTGRSGARLGPEAIRRASVHLDWEERRFPWSFRLRDELTVVDAGDLVYASGDAADMCRRLEAHADRMLKTGKTMLTLGGDHFIALPLLRAHARKFGKIALLHFDAHADTGSTGSDYDHGTPFFHAKREGLIDPAHSVQIGLRTCFDDEGFNVIDGPTANDWSAAQIAALVKEKTAGLPVYLTFDIDCLDPSFAPGTGTPVVGGISTDKALKILRSLAGLPIVGADVVEVSPAYDQSEITGLAAASIALDILHLFCRRS